jgi:hypothetical protein
MGARPVNGALTCKTTREADWTWQPLPLTSPENHELDAAVPKPRYKFSTQMLAAWTHELPSFAASCLQEILALYGGLSVHADFLHRWFPFLGGSEPIAYRSRRLKIESPISYPRSGRRTLF